MLSRLPKHNPWKEVFHFMGFVILLSQTLVQASVVGAIGAVPLLLREPNGDQLSQSSTEDWISALGELLRQRPFWWTLALCLMIGMPSALLTPLANTLFIEQYGWTATSWAVLNGGPGVTAGLVGAVGGGFLVSRYGPGRIGVLAATLHASTMLIFSLSSLCVIFGISLIDKT